MQKHVSLVDVVKSFPTNIFLQNLASIQQSTSLIKFDHLAEKSEKLFKVRYRTFQLRRKPCAFGSGILPVRRSFWVAEFVIDSKVPSGSNACQSGVFVSKRN